MFNYKQLALAIEMRTRYGKPILLPFANGIEIFSNTSRTDEIKFKPLHVIETDGLKIADLISRKQAWDNGDLLDCNKFTTNKEIDAYLDYEKEGIWINIEEDESDWLNCGIEIRFAKNTESYHLFLRKEYLAHEKMFTDLVVSQLQYWS